MPRNSQPFSQTHQRPEAICPDCEAHFDAAFGYDEAPEPGDLGVCLYCLGVHQFTTGGVASISLNTLSEDQREAIERVRDVIRAGWHPMEEYSEDNL